MGVSVCTLDFNHTCESPVPLSTDDPLSARRSTSLEFCSNHSLNQEEDDLFARYQSYNEERLFIYFNLFTDLLNLPDSIH
ncbi:hypothetical protein D3C73_655070 [compost metagenome]